MRGLAKRNDDRAGLPLVVASPRLSSTWVGRRTKADEPRTKKQELKGVPEERNCDGSLQKFERRPVLYIALFRSAILH
jgi:hypothetical protein